MESPAPLSSGEATPPEKQPFSHIIQSPVLLEALNRVGFTTATPVQAAALPGALDGQDLIVQAKTGSGKTLVFALTVIDLLQEHTDRGITRAIVLAPTRELAQQIGSVIASLSPDVSPVVMIGGVSAHEQERAMQKDSRVVVGTPGRILDFLRQRKLGLRQCEFFAVDEVDEMFSMNFVQDVRAILSRLPEERQGIFVSATITPQVESLANSFLESPEKIVIASPGEELPPVEHRYYEVKGEVTAKALALCDLIEILNPRSAIIFCNTKSDTELVEVFLRRRGFNAGLLNSDLNQKQRDAIISQLKAGTLHFLVGTDLAARGLDVAELDLVVNYSIPEQWEVYVHRTGRTGRAGRSGRALSLVGPQDFAAFLNVKRNVPAPVEQHQLPTEEEVTEARLAHFHALLREYQPDLQQKDINLGAKLLTDVGGQEAPTEDMSIIVAKLYRLLIDRVAAQKEKPASVEPRPSSPPRHSQGRDRRGGGRRHDRGGSYRRR